MKAGRLICIRSVLFCCTLTLAPILSCQSGPPLNLQCRITFRVMDYWQGIVAQQAFVVDAFKDIAGKDHSKSFQGLTGRVPCGTYNLTIRNTDYKGSSLAPLIKKELVELKHAETWMTLFTRVLIMDGREVSIDSSGSKLLTGNVRPAPGVSEMWIQFHEMFGARYVECKVDQNGEFRVYEPPNGRFLVYIIKDGKLVHVEQVAMNSPVRVTFELKGQQFSERTF